MKISKRIGFFVLAIATLFVFTFHIFASDNAITPRYNNTGSTEALFVIDSNGLATVSYTCFGYRGVTTSIQVDIKIEKKVLWWWNDVDGAQWIDYSSADYCTNEHEYQLSKKGTYKATITYTVHGTGGEADVITRELEDSY